MPGRILIASPDTDWAAEYAAALARDGHRVEVVSSWMECLCLAKSWRPDLLVLHALMSWGSAIGALAVMHDADTTPIPTLVVSDGLDETRAELRSTRRCRVVSAVLAADELRQLLCEGTEDAGSDAMTPRQTRGGEFSPPARILSARWGIAFKRQQDR
ncbi:hypothetical protein [Fimbriiglobus ruber]|uniref:Response regulatory domain-containing protein n=1 Tax=Fimbriiglobus ruber TaxID=1908690 RepID=A0A225DQ14_9BACT|nr:hypothetical protein [Fimbriiglobus ruber]OWK43361.1 hypothetical protein FRUB_02960 [Fimbriiglobus ruber]